MSTSEHFDLIIIFLKNYYHYLGVSEIRVLILTGGRTRQVMKLFSITFCKIRKSFPRFFAGRKRPRRQFFSQYGKQRFRSLDIHTCKYYSNM
jgi:hypothetical protein